MSFTKVIILLNRVGDLSGSRHLLHESRSWWTQFWVHKTEMTIKTLRRIPFVALWSS